MIQINTENTRYFNRDKITGKWDLSAYDEMLLGSKYSRAMLEQFFGRVDQIPLPGIRNCCHNKSTRIREDSQYRENVNILISDENNKLKNLGLVWELGFPRDMEDYYNIVRRGYLKLNIHGINPASMPNSITNPLMP